MNQIAALFRRLSSGVYVIGVSDGARRNGFTAAWVMQAAFQPLLVAFSINPENASYPILKAGQTFVVNVLGRDQLELARRFGTESARNHDKLAGIRWHAGLHGAPILDEALAYIECRRTGGLPAGDHELVIGEALGGQLMDAGREPLLYRETGDLDGSSALYPGSFGG